MDYKQWWSVDLKDIVHITHMLYNTVDTKSCCNRALIVETRQKQEDAWLKCKDLGNIDESPLKFVCDEKTLARYVRIRSTERCHIAINEFEVYVYVVA